MTLDASALLAFLRKEPGWQVVEVALTQSASISLLNLTEVLTKLVEAGADPTSAIADLEREGVIALPETNVVEALVQTVPFLAEDAIEAARLRRATRSLGLSLGDRVFLCDGHPPPHSSPDGRLPLGGDSQPARGGSLYPLVPGPRSSTSSSSGPLKTQRSQPVSEGTRAAVGRGADLTASPSDTSRR